MNHKSSCTSRTGPLLILGIILAFAPDRVIAQPAIVAKFTASSHTLNGTTLPYRLFIPWRYTTSKLSHASA